MSSPQPITEGRLADLMAVHALSDERGFTVRWDADRPELAQTLKGIVQLADAVPDLIAEIRRLKAFEKQVADILLERARQADELLRNRDALAERVRSLQADLGHMADLERQRQETSRVIREDLERQIEALRAQLKGGAP